MVYDNLNNVGPVLYSGFNLTSAGHAFVCDGYTQGLFHFNWGWGGSYNGYFSLDALTPAGEGIGGNGSGDYSFDQSICLNITRPDAHVNTISVPQVASVGSLLGTISDNHLIITTDGSHSQALKNLSSATIKVRGGVKIIGEDNSVAYSGWIYSASDLPSNYFFNSVEVNMANSSIRTLSEGTYKVYLVAQVDGDETWVDVSAQNGCADYVLLTKTGTDYTVTNVPAPSLTIENLQVESALYLATDFRISYNVRNASGSEIIDGLQPVLYTKKSNAPAAAGVRASALTMSDVNKLAVGDGKFYDLTDGESASTTQTSAMSGSVSSVPSGQVYLGLRSNNSDNILAEIPVSLGNKQSAGSLTLNSFSYDGDANNVNAMRLAFNVGVRCTGGYCADPVTVYIFPSSGGSSLTSVYTPSLFLSQNESETTKATGSFSTAEVGKSYQAIPYYNGSQLGSQRVVFKVGSVSGIEDVADDADINAPVMVYDKAAGIISVSAPGGVATIEIYSVEGRCVAADSAAGNTEVTLPTSALPSGILLVNVRMTDGSMMTRKIVK